MVVGKENLITGRFWWFCVNVRLAQVTCFIRSNFEMAGTVNSPKHAMQKKEQIMQVKIAVSRGSLWSIREWKMSRTSRVNGACLVRLEVEGASLVAPSRRALYSISLTCHSMP